jgi:RHS repeat-associated protein
LWLTTAPSETIIEDSQRTNADQADRLFRIGFSGWTAVIDDPRCFARSSVGHASACQRPRAGEFLLRLVSPRSANAPSVTWFYDFRNNVIDSTDQAGHVAHNVYDLAGRLTSTTTANGTPQAATTSYTYYNDGRKATSADPNQNTTTYNYDPAGRLISMVDAQNNATQYAYDDAGNQIQVTDPKGHVTKQQYDARRRLTTITYDDKTTTQYSYDGPGNLTAVTDQANNTVNYTYDYANQLRSVIQTASPNPQNTTAYQYDADGNLINLTDANNHTTQDSFDFLNQLNLEAMPAGQTQTRTYDAAGNLQTLTDYNGKTTTYTYDTLNRLLSRTPDPSLVDTPESFTYTPTGKRATMTDASGTTIYTYDAQDRLQTKATPQGTLTYTYDAAGNVASMTSSNANGVSVGYTYDSLNRLATVVDNRLPVGQNTTTYSYDPASNLATVEYPNGLQSSFTYDDLNRVTAMNAAKASYSYTLSPTGNRTGAVESSGRTLNWSYDGIYRLTNETISLDPHSVNGSVGYGLDPVGNRLNQASSLTGISSGAFTFDADDRLNTETYDANGNTLTSAGKTFTYDFENRLKSMTEGSVAVTLAYDADGNRVAKTVNGVTTRYLVDDLNPTGYAQVVEEVTAGAVTRQYTYGLQRISQTQQIANAWTPAFYGYDGGGTVRLLTDNTGTVTDTYDYDAWGNTVNSTGSTSNVYLYRGEQYDADLGLYYLTARYLNPLTGRFLSRDPDSGRIAIPATLHKYLYAGGDPVNRWDPSGAKLSETLLLIGITLEVMGPRVFYSAMYYGSQFLNEVQWSGLDAASVFCSVLTDMNFAWFVLSGFKQIGPPWEPAPLKGMCMAAAIGSR